MTIKTVLIADDEPHLLHIVGYNLAKAGLTVLKAANGEQCVAVAVRDRPDLIITDYQMPVLDGLAAAERLRADPVTADIPVLILTARGHRLPTGGLAGKTNVRAVLAKPFSARDLMAKIADLQAVVSEAA